MGSSLDLGGELIDVVVWHYAHVEIFQGEREAPLLVGIHGGVCGEHDELAAR